jgi:flagellar biosynthesis GTPase FlhF
MKKAGEAMMKQMGGKKTGTDKVLGYTCDVWEVMGTKQCLYKGIPLRVETDVMGIKNTEIATKASFGISISSDDFKMPDFPVYDMQGNQLDKSKLEAMDRESETENAEAEAQMAQMKKAFENAAREAGMEEGKSPTKTQEKAFEEAMMQAMLPQMKQSILQEEGTVRKARNCFSRADTRKEAKVCSDRISAATGEPQEEIGEWTPRTKKEMLEYLDDYLNHIVPCVKKAQTVEAIQKCIPQE